MLLTQIIESGTCELSGILPSLTNNFDCSGGTITIDYTLEQMHVVML